VALTSTQPHTWNLTLDDLIREECLSAAFDAQLARLPDGDAQHKAREFFHTTDLQFMPLRERAGEKRWEIVLPESTGRTPRWGMRLVLTQRAGKEAILGVQISRLRRLVNPRFAAIRGRVPLVGTLWLWLTSEQSGLLCFPLGRRDLEKYTRSLTVR
jgi:hypothetical protein